jgi:hypothetical protein
MFTKNELDFLKDKDLKDVEPGCPIDYGTYFFKAYGVKKNNKITAIKLDDETLGLDEYAQHLYIFEWQQLERILLESNVPKKCEFKIQGIVTRREDNTGNMVVFSLLAK